MCMAKSFARPSTGKSPKRRVLVLGPCQFSVYWCPWAFRSAVTGRNNQMVGFARRPHETTPFGLRPKLNPLSAPYGSHVGVQAPPSPFSQRRGGDPASPCASAKEGRFGQVPQSGGRCLSLPTACSVVSGAPLDGGTVHRLAGGSQPHPLILHVRHNWTGPPPPPCSGGPQRSAGTSPGVSPPMAPPGPSFFRPLAYFVHGPPQFSAGEFRAGGGGPRGPRRGRASRRETRRATARGTPTQPRKASTLMRRQHQLHRLKVKLLLCVCVCFISSAIFFFGFFP